MFIGHFALALASKKVEPEISLGTSFLAAQFADTLWPAFLAVGIERVSIVPGDTAVTPLRFDSYPWSHSLLMLAVWGALFAGVHYAARRRPRAALLLGALVVSHWVLDFVSHRPDMPLLPGAGARLGLGLWNSLPATVVVEGLLFAAGGWLCLSATRPRDGVGRWGFAALVAFLAVMYAVNLAGPPPPSVAAITWSMVLGVPVLLVWAAWVDRHRESRVPAPTP